MVSLLRVTTPQVGQNQPATLSALNLPPAPPPHWLPQTHHLQRSVDVPSEAVHVSLPALPSSPRPTPGSRHLCLLSPESTLTYPVFLCSLAPEPNQGSSPPLPLEPSLHRPLKPPCPKWISSPFAPNHSSLIMPGSS